MRWLSEIKEEDGERRDGKGWVHAGSVWTGQRRAGKVLKAGVSGEGDWRRISGLDGPGLDGHFAGCDRS